MLNMVKIYEMLIVVVRLGISSCCFNAIHRLKLKSGYYRQSCSFSQWDTDLDVGPSITFSSPFARPFFPVHFVVCQQRHALLDAAHKILNRSICYFNHSWMQIPQDWRSNPHTGYSTPALHWSLLADFDPNQGDIKWIWEPSRFEWLYVLGRAWGITGDEQYAEGIWNLLEDWRLHNPPNTGINWKCGQECSFRLFALVWGAGILEKSTTSTPQRIAKLWDTVSILASRIDTAIVYALSQNNNHGLSEAAALYLAGTCLSHHPSSAAWRTKGRRLFIRQALKQFAPDGAYIQNSVNYERVALRDAFIFVYTAQKSGDVLPDELLDRLRQAVLFLYQLQDEVTGRLPLYGPNDGANIMALSESEYFDFRPVLQTMNYLLVGERLYPPGPYDEELWWHFGAEAFSSPIVAHARNNLSAQASGYFVLNNGQSRCIVRCHSHCARPGDADMLHVDMWLPGRNIACDSGTYQYFDRLSWGEYLKSTAAHNTVTVDDHDQMLKLGKFLWGAWTKSRVLTMNPSARDGTLLWAGEHYGYRRGHTGVVHRRSVHGNDGEWLIIDDLICEGVKRHEYGLSWHLADAPDWRPHPDGAYSESLGLGFFIFASHGFELSVLQGSDYFPVTGQSRYYGKMTPITLVRATCQNSTTIRYVTQVGAAPLMLQPDHLVWKGERFLL